MLLLSERMCAVVWHWRDWALGEYPLNRLWISVAWNEFTHPECVGFGICGLIDG